METHAWIKLVLCARYGLASVFRVCHGNKPLNRTGTDVVKNTEFWSLTLYMILLLLVAQKLARQRHFNKNGGANSVLSVKSSSTLFGTNVYLCNSVSFYSNMLFKLICSSLSVTCGRFSPCTPVYFTNKNSPPRYNWNVFEAGAKNNYPNHSPNVFGVCSFWCSRVKLYSETTTTEMYM